MKIEWTDAACKALTAEYYKREAEFLSKGGVPNINLARCMLNAATAEQFRLETDAEKIKRLESTLKRIAECSSLTSVQFCRELAEYALKARMQGGE